tara:strand:- start:17826 stop:19196 length:1371 start_codon:yes stop_codon:yes gene_type:complete
MTEYTISPITFQGGADLNTLENFYERDFYNKAVHQIFLNYSINLPSPNPNYIDLWYNSPYYGKITPYGDIYIPRDEKITLAASEQKLVSFPFVYDAFNDFRSYVLRSINMGVSKLDSLFGDFKALKSYENPKVKYLYYASRVMDTYNAYLINSTNIATDINQYMEGFVNFLQKSSDLFRPFCFSDYFTSDKMPLSATGLSIELALLDHNEDFAKNRILQDESFYKYVQSAANFGFRVNKNAPWQLVADLESKPMRVYFNNHVIVSTESLFYGFKTELNFQEPYYEPAMIHEFITLGLLFHYGYNQYSKNRIYEVKDSYCIQSGYRFKSINELQIYKRKQKVVKMEEVSQSDFMSQFLADTNSLRILEKIKRFESKKQVKNHRKYDVFRRTLQKVPGGTIDNIVQGLFLISRFYNPTRVFRKTNLTTPRYFDTKGLTSDLTSDKVEYENTGIMNSDY